MLDGSWWLKLVSEKGCAGYPTICGTVPKNEGLLFAFFFKGQTISYLKLEMHLTKIDTIKMHYPSKILSSSFFMCVYVSVCVCSVAEFSFFKISD